MKIQPYICVDSLRFGDSSKEECLAAYGDPVRVQQSSDMEDEYCYSDFIIRFDVERQMFRECTLLPMKTASIVLDGQTIPITWDRSFLVKLFQFDDSPVIAHGFLILQRFGLAISGLHDGDKSQLAITVFSKGDFDLFLGDSIEFDVMGFHE